MSKKIMILGASILQLPAIEKAKEMGVFSKLPEPLLKEEIHKKIIGNRVGLIIDDLEDFLTNMKQIRKLGPLENILKMLPGARNMGLNQININPKDMAHIEAIVLSMTPYERRHPEVLKATRKQRIAKGSGRSVEEVNRLLKQFEEMKKMMKMMSNGNFKMPF